MTLIYAGLTDGAWNLFWMYLWLVSTIAASYLSERKGYGDRPGLATGLILSIARHDHLAHRSAQAGIEVEAARPLRRAEARAVQGAAAARRPALANGLRRRLDRSPQVFSRSKRAPRG